MERRTQVFLIAGFIFVIAIVVIIAAIASQGAQQASTSFVATTVPAIDPSVDHIQGDTSSKVTVIEYGDFECPACGAWEPLVEDLESKYDNRVEFVFRNFPLYQIHPFAKIGAQAAEAANLQGKYWQMHNLLYKDQGEWTANTSLTPSDVVTQFFDGYAQSLGMNVTQFNTDINSSAVVARVQRDIDSGNAAQIDHTPTFFINLAQIQNPSDEAQFASEIDAALAAANSATSTPAGQSPLGGAASSTTQ